MNGTITKIPSPNRRYLTIFLGMALFLSPFAVVPQIAGEVNLCGAVCPRMFYILSPTGIMEGCGIEMLNNSAMEAVKKASPFPKPPVEAQVVVPIVYKLY